MSDVSRLDTMVTVVDAANLIKNYSSTDFLKDRGESIGENDDRTLVDLLVEQIEFANIIILNKIDLATSDEIKVVKGIIRGLNVKAKIIETTLSKVNIEEVMDTQLFNIDEAQEHPLWAHELNNFGEHIPETEEYGITSFVYRARAPFDPVKVHSFFNQEWPAGQRGFSGYHLVLTLLERCLRQALLSAIRVLVVGGLLYQENVGLKIITLTGFGMMILETVDKK